MKRLLILSGKGGTGKTTTAAAFIHFSKARAWADCDVDAPNLHLVTPPKGQPEVTEFLGGEKALIDPEKCIGCGLCQKHCRFGALLKKEEVYEVNEYSCEGCGVCAFVCPKGAVRLEKDAAGQKELYLEEGVFSTARLKMGRGNSGKLVTEVKLAMLKHAPETELAIIDGSPGIGCPVMASMSGMDQILVVAEPSFSGLNDLKRLIETAGVFQIPIAVCVNKADTAPERTEDIRRFCRKENLIFVGTLPYDQTASEMINQGKSIAETEGPLKEAFKKVYEKTMDLMFTPKDT